MGCHSAQYIRGGIGPSTFLSFQQLDVGFRRCCNFTDDLHELHLFGRCIYFALRTLTYTVSVGLSVWVPMMLASSIANPGAPDLLPLTTMVMPVTSSVAWLARSKDCHPATSSLSKSCGEASTRDGSFAVSSHDWRYVRKTAALDTISYYFWCDAQRRSGRQAKLHNVKKQ